MPEPATHSGLIITLSLTSVVSFLFDIPAGAVFAAFFASIIGVALSESAPPKTKILTVIAVTFSAAYLTPLAVKYLGDYSAKGVAFVIALLISWDVLRNLVWSKFKQFITAWRATA